MSMKLLRLGLQFFAGGTKEEEDEVIIPGEEGVTGASGVTGSTTPAYTMPQNTVAAPKAQDFDTWYKANGGMDEAGYYAKYDLDPDRDYQNTVNTLNYDYQTSMATYGEQAEKLYQMGLQNSGVSDIFQANAFSSYLGNMNQAAANRITARKRNKAAFNDYVANMRAQHGQYESGINTEYDTKLNSALAFALDRYNGYNLNSVLSELGVAGYYTEVIQAVGDKLSGIDATSLASLQAQTENNLAQSILTAFPNLTEADKSAVKNMFGGMVPDDALNAAFNRAKTTYQNSKAGQDATLNGYIDQYYGGYDGTNIDSIDLSGIENEDMQTKVKEGIKQKFTNTVAEIYNIIKNNYTPENAAALKLDIKNTYPGKYTDAEIDEAFTQAKNVYNNSAVGQEASVDELVNSYGAQFDPNYSYIGLDPNDNQIKIGGDGGNGSMNAFIENVMGIITNPKDLEFDQAAYDRAVKAWEQMNSTYNSTLRNNILNAYGLIADLPASATDDDLKSVISMSGQTFNDAEIDGAIKRFRDINDLSRKIEASAIEDAVDAAVEDTETKFSEKGTDYTFKDINNAFAEVDSIEATYGKSDNTKSARNNYSSKGAKLVEDFMNGNKDIDDVAAVKKYLEGFLSSDNLTNWDSLDDEGKRKAIVEAAVGAADKIGEASKKKIIDEYVEWKTKDILDFDKNNAGETALANAGALVSYVKSLGLMNGENKEIINSIIDELEIKYDGTFLKWKGDGEASLGSSYPTEVKDESLIQTLNSIRPEGYHLISYNNKLYQADGNTWREVTPDNVRITLDWHTNTDEERKGTYDLLVVLLESGYVQGELPSSTTIKPSGGAGEIKIRDDHNYFQSETANPEGNAFQVKK